MLHVLITTSLLTLKEFLAGILLEEGLVGDGTCEIINHKLEYRLHFFLVIASIVSQSSVLSLFISSCSELTACS